MVINLNLRGLYVVKLTAKQERVFQFICQFADEMGFPPSYAEIAQNFGFNSDGTVRTHLEQLEKKGFIKRLGQARGIQILKGTVINAIPIMGRIAAGSPILAIEDSIGTLDDVDEIKYADGRFALTVRGDSMIDAGIMDGDLAIIQTNIPVNNGQIAAIMVDGEATLKRVYYERERVRLQPENEFYDPLYLDRRNIDASIVGRYIALVRRG